jgi:hypothetical protein
MPSESAYSVKELPPAFLEHGAAAGEVREAIHLLEQLCRTSSFVRSNACMAARHVACGLPSTPTWK